ncbi:hypothetical protein B0J17DRAFT_666990 [Rhizoctonia solani]|nr:hypothetical protein B0J17DRAFT_666990 [Rhizoctonia solani]
MPRAADLAPGSALSRANAQRRLEAQTTVGYNRPLPNVFGYTKHRYSEYDDEKRRSVKPLVELEMTQFSAELRRKPSWWTKCRDETILSKWREEALAQAKLMKESHIDYVLEELTGYANLRDERSGAEVSCHDGIWQSDTLISAVLKEQLVTGVTKLEDVPESKKGWHPHSNRQVLDLVDPSLYPIVYGRTLSFPEDSSDRSPAALQLRLKSPEGPVRFRLCDSPLDFFISKRFQWLPTDFEVSEDGTSARSLSYINNIHPQEYGLYKTIEGLISAYIPLFEHVLTDCIQENYAIPERTYSSGSYDWNPHSAPPNSTDYSDAQKYNEAYVEWRKGCIMSVPHVDEAGYLAGSLEKRLIEYKLGGRTIQVVVKLTSIHLTPEKPEYTGGLWRVEGMLNEVIVASGIYCYDEENVTESRLAFRTAVSPPHYYEDEDKGCVQTWGMPRGGPCVNELGSVLVDKSKPGHRKIVALFLVDPAVRVPSTSVVPPQQQEWRASAIRANPVLKTGFDKLSSEIIDHIHSMAGGTMTREEAEAYRLELMDERTACVAQNNEVSIMMP